MPNSMTGFARLERQAPWGALSCEIRSVNHRYLEPTIRLPESLRALEPMVRDLCRKQLQRGKIEVSVSVSINDIASEAVSINTQLVAQITQATSDIQDIIHSQGDADVSLPSSLLAPIDPLALLKWPGVITQETVDKEQMEVFAKTLVNDVLDLLLAHRQREGQELKAQIEQRLTAISTYVSEVRAQMPTILQAQREKLQQRLADLHLEVDPDRLEQEIALLANKADVDEELDRLSIHIAEVNHILQQNGSIGRRLDFMMQELNREANTLSSKAIHTDTTQAAVSLKVLIEQMREQIQNME